MIRLVRIPLVLAFAALWAAGSYALGYLLLPDRLTFALGAAFVGGVVTGVVMGGLTSRVWAVLLGIPLAIGAMTTSVYAAGIHYLEAKPRLQVVVATAQCVQSHASRRASNRICDKYSYTFNDTSGRPVSYELDLEDRRKGGNEVGKTLDVYLRDPGVVKIWPVSDVEPRDGVRTGATITVPLFVGYVVLLGIVGAISRVAWQRRFRERMNS